MPPRSPLPRLDGLDPSWVRTPDRVPGSAWPPGSYRDFLADRLPAGANVDAMLASGGFVDGHGRPIDGAAQARPSTVLWFYRPPLPEPAVSGPLHLLHVDARLVVVDKPPFLATTPRGSHVQESVVVRLRRAGFPDVAPVHRLDRLTAGVLVLTRERQWRAAYAGVFAGGGATKTYEALGRYVPQVALPRTIEGRIEKQRGELQARTVPGTPNASTHIELMEVRGGLARYRLTPRTGKTHQLRLHLADLGLPIVGDPLYPVVRDTPEDLADPLRLVAGALRFTDPVTGRIHRFESSQRLAWPTESGLAH